MISLRLLPAQLLHKQTLIDLVPARPATRHGPPSPPRPVPSSSALRWAPRHGGQRVTQTRQGLAHPSPWRNRNHQKQQEGLTVIP